MPRRRSYPWVKLAKPELMQLRLCDLGVSIEGTWLEDPIATVLEELEARNLRLRPHFWLSEEWFSPSGIPGVAVPFYLAHPRLMRLERNEMLSVEGGSRTECLRVLRHELGHAIDHAYEVSKRRSWREHFGSRRQSYPDYYRPNPASKRYVQHLGYWYAQSHPDEDFAETFAVWLNPRSAWRKRYAGWKALKKLEYVDELMVQLAGRAPKVRSRRRYEPLSRLKHTLGEHYEHKRARYRHAYPTVYDQDLRRIFRDPEDGKRGPTAAAFLRKHRRAIRHQVARWTGEYEFTLDQVFEDMILRAQELRLRARGSERQMRLDFAILLTVKTMHHLYAHRHWLPL